MSALTFWSLYFVVSLLASITWLHMILQKLGDLSDLMASDLIGKPMENPPSERRARGLCILLLRFVWHAVTASYLIRRL